MKLRPLTGTLTALVTPFRQQKVAYEELRALVNFQIKSGINGLVPAGSTGEAATLSHEEHMDVVRCVIETARDRVPVVAGTGSNSTLEARELTQAAHAAGADAMLVVAPYYNRPTQEGLFRHFSAVAETTDRPIILYSIPSRCGVEIGVPVVERLRARFPHVRYIKESGGSVDRVDQLKQALGSDLVVISGDDSLTLPFMAVGAEGVISVASNLLPRALVQLTHLALAGDFRRAGRLHRRLYPVFKALFIETNPVPIKAALAAAGRIRSPEVRLPLCELAAVNLASLQRTLAAAT
ncbi:MAG: 4-hydroxy-tetrahydrodipicolinate synthase [Opitutaceae bacterium]|nr:4-hydroxy-tetrahydrodipicolinate synthase [Opitutaceae bacterium]